MTESLRHGVATDIGARRAQEDSFLTAPPLFAVADGMGGHNAGDVASQTALQVLGESMSETDEGLVAGVKRANDEVFRRSSSESGLSGMGTTITALVAEEASAQVAHVGDSRAYLLRDGRLERLTHDHTVANRLARQGRIRSEEADRHPQRSVLERAIGVDADVDVDVQVIDVHPGDRFLLCTDGLTSILGDDEIQEILETEADPSAAADRLVEEAVKAGASDNVTALVVDYPGPRPTRAAGAPGPARATLGPAPPASPAPPVFSDLAPRPRRRRILGAWLGIVAVVVATALLLGRQALANQWFVGDDHGRVAVFRGIPGSIAGLNLNSVEERTEVMTSSLTSVYRRRIREGISAKDRQAAQSIVENLRQLQSESASATPTPPAPGGYYP